MVLDFVSRIMIMENKFFKPVLMGLFNQVVL